ncbi:MAG TPA: VIT domain-containing protein [Cyanophyceae cyanobacterium]
MLTNAPSSSNKRLGGLYVRTISQPLTFPLKHTDVQVKISGNVSRVSVTQTFENPFTQPLEALYVFPLPDEAAVDRMEIKIGDRTINGNIKRREEAIALYEQARNQGRTTALLEQQRDNVFTQSLANIRPGETIDVTIGYTDSLKFQGGDYEFCFPMVVGPRFIPGNPIDDSGDTASVPDASQITPPLIPPAMRSRHDINVTVEIDAGIPISNVRSTSHDLKIEQDGSIVRVQLGDNDRIPNKDLVLRYRVAGEQAQATVLSHVDERGAHFALYLIPAVEYRTDEIVPKDVVFLMDTSGSQMGDPLIKSQELMRRFINELNPDDTFTIIDFSDITTQLSPHPLTNTPENRAKAIEYINQLRANGGTYLLNGIQAVLHFPAAPTGRLRSIVLITDGYIGNENEVLAEVQQKLQPGNRLYTFGVGSSPNRFLLNRIAEIGRGTCQIVRHDEPTEEVSERFFRQINNPVLTNINVSWDGTGEAIIYPSTAPDLFAQQPLVLFGRISPSQQSTSQPSNLPTSQQSAFQPSTFQPSNLPTFQPSNPSGALRITGMMAGGIPYETVLNLSLEDVGNPAIAQIWGRARIKDLMNQMFRYEKKAGVESVTQTALTYQLLSQYTAFVAVTEEVRIDPEGNSILIEVPVEIPEGMSYQGLFSSRITRSAERTRSRLALSSPVLDSQSLDCYTALPSASPALPMPQPSHSSATPAPRKRGFLGGLFGGKAKPQAVASQLIQTLENEEEFDSTRINPDSIQDLEEGQSNLTTSQPTVQVISATGLDTASGANLRRYLQQLVLPSGLSGELVFEFLVRNGRVVRVLLDEDASTLKEDRAIELIKRSLITWRVPQLTASTVCLTLRIQS